MDQRETQAVLTICLMAALVDGAAVERERDEVQRIAQALSATELEPAVSYDDVVAKRVDLRDVARALATDEAKQHAYEMAFAVCGADGPANDVELRFLTELRAALGLASAQTAPVSSAANSIATAPLAAGSAPVSDAEIDSTIQGTAILCAALEQIPQTLATMAIVPLQMRMVFKIGKHYGYELDRGHVADFLATAGLGMTAQVLDGFARRLVGGFLGRFAGGFGGGLGRRAVGSALAFGTTYALGHLAKRYYAGGRKLSASELRATFEDLLGRARGVEAQHAATIASRARTLGVSDLGALVRGV